MNGNDDWIPIRLSDIQGWVRPKYLDRVWPTASLADDSTNPTQDAASNLEPLYRSPTTEPPKLSDRFKNNDRGRERSGVSESGSGFGWFVFIVIAIFVIGAATKAKKKSSPPGAQRRARWAGEDRERRERDADYRAALLYDQQRKRERNE
jgi:hypothetical protein